MSVPTLTPAAGAHLAGRTVLLRGSPRHGCCGGRALLPVAEIAVPDDPERYERVVDGEVTWFIEPALRSVAGTWTLDVMGFGRWRRLHLDGAEQLEPGRHHAHEDSCASGSGAGAAPEG